MGVVYLAEDNRLNRKVALKFLPKHFTSDTDARERFEREARAAAALNHPNIVTVYDIGEADGQVFMAIEPVEGQTLADCISAGPLPFAEVLDITRQIAEGLGKAHEAGIVHRDIKPSNIMLDRDGRVKILDFGLAKLKGSSKLTREASTLGTVQYMSPEQARGDEVDGRSDIWSIGAVLYEMLTCRQPFTGDYDQHVIYSILNEEPEAPGTIRKDLPIGLERVVRKALRKDPDERYQDTGGIIRDLNAGDREGVANRSSGGAVVAKWVFAAVAIVTAAVVVIKLSSGDGSRRSHDPVSRQFTFTGDAEDPSISPDGKMVAFAAGGMTPDGAVYIKDIESGSKVKILSSSRTFNIKWAPDGSKLIYSEFISDENSGTYLLPCLGGSPRMLLRLPWYFISWAPEGDRIACSLVGSGELFILDIVSGDTTVVLLDQDIGEIEDIDWSPSGEEILLQGNDHEMMSLWTVEPDGRGLTRLFEIDQASGFFLGNPRWSPCGDAIYYLETGIRGQFISDLMKVGYDRSERLLDGESKTVLSNLSVVNIPGLDISYSISDDGKRLVFEQRSERMDLWMMRAEGEGEEVQWKTRRLTNSTMLKTKPSLSPDGGMVTFAMGNERSFDIYTLALPANHDEPVAEPVRLTYLESNSDLPAYSPDGKEIAFYSMDDDIMRIWRVDAGGGTPRPWTSSRGSMMDQELTWSPGEKIIYRAGKFNNYRILDPSTGEESDLIETEFKGAYTFSPQWSNRRDRVALFQNVITETSQEMRIYLLSLSDGNYSSISGAMYYPVGWSSDDRSIFVLNFPEDWSNAGEMFVFRMDPVDGSTEEHAPVRFAPNEVRELVISPDGRTIVFLHRITSTDIWLVEDFDPGIE